MPLILNIDTATDHASVCISDDEKILGLQESSDQKNHASFVQPAIELLCAQLNLPLRGMDAIAVTAGPGSYTGLRVGMATAKGICYALDKPLILVDTLEVMAQSMLPDAAPGTLLCPLIDARRMEVFTALYDEALNELQAPHALILEESPFAALLGESTVLFGGSGMEKLKTLLQNTPTAHFSSLTHNATHLAIRALKAWQAGHFAELAYSEPLYVKPFFDTAKRK